MFEGLFGLNKPRSRLGHWLDKRGVSQMWLVKTSGVSRKVISLACNEDDYIPSGRTMQKIVNALREIDPRVKADMFWDL